MGQDECAMTPRYGESRIRPLYHPRNLRNIRRSPDIHVVSWKSTSRGTHSVCPPPCSSSLAFSSPSPFPPPLSLASSRETSSASSAATAIQPARPVTPMPSSPPSSPSPGRPRARLGNHPAQRPSLYPRQNSGHPHPPRAPTPLSPPPSLRHRPSCQHPRKATPPITRAKHGR